MSNVAENATKNKEAKLTLRLDTEDGKVFERVFEGADKIDFLLGEAGILDDELKAALKCD